MTSEHSTDLPRDANAVPDVFPDFAVSLEEANRRVRMLQEFVRDHMMEGEDYGVIPGSNGKPTLFKPGAEKLNAIFGLAPVVEITNRVEDWDKGFVAYEVKVTLLNKRTSQVEAEGVGLCNSRERRYKNQDAANIANTVLKMSKKRALVDATLSATRASGVFTQDLEDLELDRMERESSGYRGGAVNAPQAPLRGRPEPGHHGAGSNGSQPGPHDGLERRGEAASTSAGGHHAATTTHFGPGGPNNTLTDAQRGAILSMANKAFGQTAQEELSRLIEKPIAQLTKSEASTMIDRLRALLIEQQLPREGRSFAGADQ